MRFKVVVYVDVVYVFREKLHHKQKNNHNLKLSQVQGSINYTTYTIF